MTGEEKKIIFFSHSHADLEIIKPIKEAFFCENNLKNEYALYFTSDPHDPKVQGHNGMDVWNDAQSTLSNCEYFVAFVSPNFFKSQTCQNELGAIKAFESKANHDRKPKLIFVKIEEFTPGHEDSNFIVGPKIIMDDLSNPNEGKVRKFINHLKDAMENIYDEKNEIWKNVVEGLKNAQESRDNAKEHRVVSLWIKHLNSSKHINASKHKTPVMFFVELAEYPGIAVDLSKKANDKLIWAVNRSPLLVKEAYSSDGVVNHVEHDKMFEDLASKSKHRLVIFKDKEEAESYLTCDVNYHRTQTGCDWITEAQIRRRKLAFEKSLRKSKGKLWFTTRDLIKHSFNEFFRDDKQDEDYWDFGYIQNSSLDFLFVSGFGSPSFVKDSGSVNILSHLIFYSEPHIDRYNIFRSNPYYQPLFGKIRGLFEVVNNLTKIKTPLSGVFYDKNTITKLIK